MTKQDFIMSYFELVDEEEPDASYYRIKEGYTCLYSEEYPVTTIMVDDDGVYIGGDNTDSELVQPEEWHTISVYTITKIEYQEEE